MNSSFLKSIRAAFIFVIAVSAGAAAAAEDTVYAATFGAGGGVSISTDGGTSFQNRGTANGLGSNAVEKVFVADGIIYAATSSGLSISTDGGMTFVNRTTGDGLGSDSVRGVCVENGVIFAATANGLSISSDGGITFTNLTMADGLVSNSLTGIHSAGGNVFVAAFGGGVSVTRAGGGSFTNFTGTLNGSGGSWLAFGPHRMFGFGSRWFICGITGLYFSDDDGASWTRRTTADGLPADDCYGVSVAGSTIYVATDGGLAISNDGGATFSYRTTADGLAGDHARDVIALGSTVYVATSTGLSISTDSGQTFSNRSIADGLGENFVLGLFVQRPGFRPDCLIGPSTSRLRGNNLYNLSGSGQSFKAVTRKRRLVRFAVRVENDDTLDIFRVGASRGNRLFDVAYRIGTADETAALVGNRYLSVPQATGSYFTIGAVVRPEPRSTTRRRSSIRLGVTATSTSDPVQQDRVLSRILSKNLP